MRGGGYLGCWADCWLAVLLWEGYCRWGGGGSIAPPRPSIIAIWCIPLAADCKTLIFDVEYVLLLKCNIKSKIVQGLLFKSSKTSHCQKRILIKLKGESNAELDRQSFRIATSHSLINFWFVPSQQKQRPVNCEQQMRCHIGRPFTQGELNDERSKVSDGEIRASESDRVVLWLSWLALNSTSQCVYYTSQVYGWVLTQHSTHPPTWLSELSFSITY